MDQEKQRYFDNLNNKIEKSGWYIFMQRHDRVIKILEGILIILLLIGLNSYLFKDRSLKEQIAENCGYTNNEYSCICEKSYVDANSGIIDINKLNFTPSNNNE